MATFEKCPQEVRELADELILKFDSHKPLAAMGVKVDLIFAHANLDKDGFPAGDAIKHHGIKALGVAKIIPLKQRVAGRPDAEITLDGDWWKEAKPAERDALLDHELHHLTIATDKTGKPKYDDIGRPKLRMRQHDHDFGWFSIIAVRHGIHSQECQQAEKLMEGSGQFYWPELAGKSRSKKLTA